jgi:hypothetical protein
MAYQDVKVSGLEEVIKLLDGQRVTKELKVKVSSLVTGLHSDIRKEVFTRYKINQDKLNSALVGKSISNVTEGANIIKSGFIYKHKATPLAPFFSSSFMGNINAGAMRQGLVHRVEIRRGLQGIVYGKEHRGGFIPVNRIATTIAGKKPIYKKVLTSKPLRANMYERKSDKALPLRLLFAPSPAQLVQRTLNSSSSLLQKRVDEFTKDVTNLFIKK